jgi:hypothetical protein
MLEYDVDILGVPCSKKSIRWDRIQNAVARRTLEWAHNNPACQNGNDPAALLEQYKRSDKYINPAMFPNIASNFVMNFMPFQGDKILELDKLQEMSSMGTGLLMIKREVFLAYKKAYPDRWYESKADPDALPGPIWDFFKAGVDPETREYDSEDYAFCKCARAIGFKVWMLPWVKTSHMGTNTFIGDMPTALALTGEIF